MRYASLALAIRTLEREQVEGAFAEVGVYQGATSRFLQQCTPERRLYLLLDLDVFRPTLAGLEFFYPRLARGAYVFVHDYNSPESNPACFRAVDQAMRGKPEGAVESPRMRRPSALAYAAPADVFRLLPERPRGLPREGTDRPAAG